MNKNLQSLPSSFQEIDCPKFESHLEIFEWIVYQQKEILLLLQCHLNHGVRTGAFCDHFDKVNCYIRNELIKSKEFEETVDSKLKIQEVRSLADEMGKKCQDIRRCPMI